MREFPDRLSDHEHLPGTDREREKYGTFPILASEVVGSVALSAMEQSTGTKPERRSAFPFQSWAARAGFSYPEGARSMLCLCESALEAYFVREFAGRPGVVFEAGSALAPDGTRLRVQVRRGFARIDAVADRGPVELAIELDGSAYHGRRYDQLAAEYLRERRLVALGYVLVRFTARDVFKDPGNCWSQINAILNAHVQRLTR